MEDLAYILLGLRAIAALLFGALLIIAVFTGSGMD